jgi:hypothetical protein
VDECFKQIDTNNDGKLSYEEFKAAVESQKLLINCFVHYSSPIPPVPSSSSSSTASSISVINNTNTDTTKSSTTTINSQDSSKKNTTSGQSNIPNLNLETTLTPHFEDPITPRFEF